MGFAIRVKDGEYIPAITCDTCHDIVEDWLMAVVTHEDTLDKPLLSARVVHKETCDRGSSLTEDYEPDRAWHELEYFIPRLLWNNGWGEKGMDSEGDATVSIKVLQG
jgi:hypothetical protein